MKKATQKPPAAIGDWVQVSPTVAAARAMPLFTGGVKADNSKSPGPALRMAMDCGVDVCPTVWFRNDKLAGVMLNVGTAAATAVAVKGTRRGKAVPAVAMGELNAIIASPFTTPGADGAKIKVITQVSFGSNCAVALPKIHVPPAAPTGRTMPDAGGKVKVSRVIATPPIFLIVVLCGPLAAGSVMLPNAKVVGSADAARDSGDTPVPDVSKLNDNPPGMAVLVTPLDTLPFCVPNAVGLNVTVTMQLALAASGLALAQVSVTK